MNHKVISFPFSLVPFSPITINSALCTIIVSPEFPLNDSFYSKLESLLQGCNVNNVIIYTYISYSTQLGDNLNQLKNVIKTKTSQSINISIIDKLRI